MEYLKKDLVKIMVLAFTILAVMIALVVWNNKSGVLDNLAAKLFTAIGKPFKMGFYGKITTNKNGTKFLKTMFSQGKNNILPVTSADTEVNISTNKDETDQFYNGTTTSTTTANKATVTDDLPF